jgi:hypothetical protein
MNEIAQIQEWSRSSNTSKEERKKEFSSRITDILTYIHTYILQYMAYITVSNSLLIMIPSKI